MPCLDDHQIHLFVSGTLADPERQVVEAELARCGKCAALVAAVARSEQQDDDRYELGETIARGGMGTIVSAYDRRLRRSIALKRLDTVDDPARARFEREIAVTASLQHPNIVPIYDAGVLGDGQPFYAMRHVPGASLDVVIANAQTPEARRGLLAAITDAADAVAYAHEQGVVHRDLKPLNILVGPFGETVVIDWGLAKVAAVDGPVRDVEPYASGGDIGATRDGTILGTPRYMSPEQARGEVATTAADVYALGAILYHAIAGRPAIDDTDPMAAVDRVASGRVVPLAEVTSGIPRDLLAIVDRAMATAAGDRYTASELAADLRRFRDGQMVTAYRYSRPDRVSRFVRRHRIAVSVVAVAAIALVVIGAASVVRVVRERDAAERAGQLADDQRRRAETDRAGADGLFAFMVGDLRQTLAAIGRIDVLAGVADRIDAYLDRTTAGREHEPATLIARARVLEIRALAAARAGDDVAASMRAKALALLDESDAGGATAPSLEVRAALLNAQARAAANRGDGEAALAIYRKAIDALHRMPAHPGPNLAELNIAAAYTAMADLDLKHDRAADADRDFAEAAEALNRARTGSADDLPIATRRAMLGVTRGLAKVAREQLDDATREFEGVVSDMEKHATGPHATNELRRLAWMGLTMLAQVRYWQGAAAQARPLYTRAHALAETSVRVEPNDLIRRSELGISDAGLADAAFATGDEVTARTYADAAAAVLDPLAASHPADRALVEAAINGSQTEARVYRKRDPRRAVAALTRAAERIDKLTDGTPRLGNTAKTRLAFAHVRATAAMIAMEAGDRSAATANLDRATAALDVAPNDHDTATMMFDRLAALTACAVVETRLGRAAAKPHSLAAADLATELATRVTMRATWRKELEAMR